MDERKIKTIADIAAFLAGTDQTELRLQGSKDDIYAWIERTLNHLSYFRLSKKEKGRQDCSYPRPPLGSAILIRQRLATSAQIAMNVSDADLLPLKQAETCWEQVRRSQRSTIPLPVWAPSYNVYLYPSATDTL